MASSLKRSPTDEEMRWAQADTDEYWARVYEEQSDRSKTCPGCGTIDCDDDCYYGAHEEED